LYSPRRCENKGQARHQVLEKYGRRGCVNFYHGEAVQTPLFPVQGSYLVPNRPGRKRNLSPSGKDLSKCYSPLRQNSGLWNKVKSTWVSVTTEEQWTVEPTT
jgi:hypothetical protein